MELKNKIDNLASYCVNFSIFTLKLLTVKEKNINIVILTILVLGVIITGFISYREFFVPNTCMKFSIIPSCFLVFFYFLVLLFSFFLKKDFLFILFSGFALVLAVFASVGHFFTEVKCYQFPIIKIPVCVAALFLFVILIVLKFYQTNNKK